MDPPSMRRDVERWLVHEGYRFTHIERDGNAFTMLIRNTGAYGHHLEVFQPIQRRAALVAGSIIPMSNFQHARYQRLSDIQKTKLETRVHEYCRSIGAICRTRRDLGLYSFGVYAVIDDEELFVQRRFAETLALVVEMGDGVTRLLRRYL